MGGRAGVGLPVFGSRYLGQASPIDQTGKRPGLDMPVRLQFLPIWLSIRGSPVGQLSEPIWLTPRKIPGKVSENGSRLRCRAHHALIGHPLHLDLVFSIVGAIDGIEKLFALTA